MHSKQVGLQHKWLTFTLSPPSSTFSNLHVSLLSPFILIPLAFLPPYLSPPRSPCSPHRGYLVAAPSVFRAGVEESVSVTIFNAKAETRVQVQLTVKGQTVAHSHGSLLGENKAKVTPASLLERKTCANKSSCETPRLCDLLEGCGDHTSGKNRLKIEPLIDTIFDCRHQFHPSHQPLCVYTVWCVWQHH